jgi:hypothetical protein
MTRDSTMRCVLHLAGGLARRCANGGRARRLNRAFLLVAAIAGPASPVAAQTSFPMITHANPVAVQRGKTAEVVVEGQMSFVGCYKALFEGTGVTAEVITPPAPPDGKAPAVKNVKLKVTVESDAALGVREFRVASFLGVSSVGQLVIVDDPVVAEAQANNTTAQAQVIQLPCVVAGRIEAVEDVDFLKFEAKEGDDLSFELFCARLQDKIHDLQKHAKPMLTLYDGDGRELAANDHFYFADPMLSYRAPQTGTYYLQVRDSTYDGDARWAYALLATNRPYASHVYPMAGNPGKTIEVEPIGSAGHVKPKVPLLVPAELGVRQVQLDLGGTLTNPVTFYVSELPQFEEQEPNDTPETATRITVPAGINGRIGKKRDLDHFVFAAKKGEALRVELKARRFGTLLNSGLHGILEILSPKGAVLAGNDATHGLEASLVFTPPADGDYVLRVRDLNSKGGDRWVYHIELSPSRPDFTIRCDPDKAMIGPGSSTAWYVHVNRTGGFAGPVQVEVRGLPKDVTASPLTIPPSMTQGVIVVTAAATAAPCVENVQLVGTAKVKGVGGKDETLTRCVTPNQEIYFPGGGRGKFDVTLLTVAVTGPSDILKVDVSTTQVVLKPGQEVKIDVTVHRRQDYTKGVTLDVLMQHLGQVFGNPLPPGVTIEAGKSKTLLGDGSQGSIVLKAAPNAEPIEDVPIAVVANVSINFVVKIPYSSPPILVSVRK